LKGYFLPPSLKISNRIYQIGPVENINVSKDKSKHHQESDQELHDKKLDQQAEEFFEEQESSEQATASEQNVESVTLETLKQQLETLKQKADKNWDLAVRAKAELDNVRKRAEMDISNAHKYALDRFIPELFPLLDGLEQGLLTLPQDETFNSARDGLNLSIKMFSDMLVRFGVEIVDPINTMFDPAQHEAIAMLPNPEVANGTILNVVQKGYVLHKRVLRPARVVVTKN